MDKNAQKTLITWKRVFILLRFGPMEERSYTIQNRVSEVNLPVNNRRLTEKHHERKCWLKVPTINLNLL
ncbi:1186_t:CDS:2 [Diversispora eburnea]|uniref:1186_t:CDS:1 n=1 Tax=Diversispora eburnea TaxID=1213867 RepID=A0A9N8ZUD2_9GLOM|nr:1186_t:CDS:2 [Diversispora eburnea]